MAVVSDYSLLHNQPWILPWIKLIFNMLNITFLVHKLQLLHRVMYLRPQLCCRQQHVNWVSKTWGQCVKINTFIVIYGYSMCCKKLNDVCTLNCLCAYRVYIYLVALQIVETWGGGRHNIKKKKLKQEVFSVAKKASIATTREQWVIVMPQILKKDKQRNWSKKCSRLTTVLWWIFYSTVLRKRL